MEDTIRDIANQIALKQGQLIREELEKRGYTFERLLHSDCQMVEHHSPEGLFRQYIVDGEVVLHAKITYEVVLDEPSYIYREIVEILN